jgi:hypothetical protein
MQFSLACCYLILLMTEHFPQHVVLKHSLYSSLHARDQVLHPYKTTGKITIKIQISTRRPPILTERFLSFPQSLQANAWIEP